MDIATTMAAVNYFNMVNTWNMLAMQDTELFTVTENGKEDEMMSGSILDTYIGKDCAVSPPDGSHQYGLLYGWNQRKTDGRGCAVGEDRDTEKGNTVYQP